ncbi:MAG: hypothetical protein IJM49_01650 [Firmicutes bacterium]|nr:hypothetical protein [Bacillota bacterium]MBR0481378.1 hypothetical protein [Bacillota bacterium]
MRDLLLFFTIILFMGLGYLSVCVFEKELFSHFKVEEPSFPSFDNEICIITGDETYDEKMEAFAGFIGRHEKCTVILLDGQSEDISPKDLRGKCKAFRCKGA